MKLRILKTYFSLLASTMAYMGKTDKKLKFLGNEKRYRDEIKSIFIFLEGFQIENNTRIADMSFKFYCFLFTLTSSYASKWKKFELFFSVMQTM